MPSLGADMDAGTLIEWLVAPGDEVKRGDIVAVVETQKGAIDVEIYESGTVVELVVPVDTEVPVGTVLAYLRIPGEVGPVVPTEEERVATSAAESPNAEVPAQVPASTALVAGPPGTRVAPRARKLAAKLGVDLSTVEGTGPGGSVIGEDVERAGPASPAAPASGMRGAIAAAMARSKREIPHYYLAHTIDLEPALVWLETTNAPRPVTERLLPIALLVRAVALALSKYPEFSGWYKDGRFVPSPGVHIGLAVSLRRGGLVNPALHDADRGTLGELMVKIRDVTKRARSGGLRASEFADASTTVTSLGDQGVDGVFGVIHPPQVAIVGFGAISVRPWVVGGRVMPRRLVQLSLAADHRVSDGHRGGRFAHEITNLLSQPETL